MMCRDWPLMTIDSYSLTFCWTVFSSSSVALSWSK
jgi:hypothetical protein